jgi:hypothetical protein
MGLAAQPAAAENNSSLAPLIRAFDSFDSGQSFCFRLHCQRLARSIDKPDFSESGGGAGKFVGAGVRKIVRRGSLMSPASKDWGPL